MSHQIRALEDYLATALFVREGNRVMLTGTGRTYAGQLTRLLDYLDRETADARAPGRTGTLRVLSTPGFAARWLLPRLPRFAERSAIRLRIAEGAPSTDFATNQADVVIQWRDTEGPELDVVPLLQSGRYPVVAPALLAAHRLDHPRDLLKHTLFRDEVDDQWEEWFRAAGVVAKLRDGDPCYPNCEYATTAAEAGLGVSLAYDAVVRQTVEEGRLVRLFDAVTGPFVIYAIACDAKRSGEPLIGAFRDWVLAEAAAERVLPAPGLSAAQ